MRKVSVALAVFVFAVLFYYAVVFAEDNVAFDEGSMDGVVDKGNVTIHDCFNSKVTYEAHVLIINYGEYDAAPGNTLINCISEKGVGKDQELFSKYVCKEGNNSRILISEIRKIECSRNKWQ